MTLCCSPCMFMQAYCACGQARVSSLTLYHLSPTCTKPSGPRLSGPTHCSSWQVPLAVRGAPNVSTMLAQALGPGRNVSGERYAHPRSVLQG